jgi:hypothetical protein
MLSACFASYSDMLVVALVKSRFVAYVFHIHFTLQQLICIYKQEVLKQLIAYIPLMLHGPRRKFKLPTVFIVARVFIAAVTFLSSCYLTTIGRKNSVA